MERVNIEEITNNNQLTKHSVVRPARKYEGLEFAVGK